MFNLQSHWRERKACALVTGAATKKAFEFLPLRAVSLQHSSQARLSVPKLSRCPQIATVDGRAIIYRSRANVHSGPDQHLGHGARWPKMQLYEVRVIPLLAPSFLSGLVRSSLPLQLIIILIGRPAIIMGIMGIIVIKLRWCLAN